MTLPNTARSEFIRRLHEEWLPAYCQDAERRYFPDDSPLADRLLTEGDARDFLRALDSGVVSLGHRQFLVVGGKRSSETLFTEGHAKFTPRRVRLWLESFITAASAGRLHFNYGWPVDHIEMQSKDNAFDLVAFTTPDRASEHLVVEVKKTSREVDQLLRNLTKCCAGEHEKSCLDGKRKNAHRKWAALQARQPKFFWVVGPSPFQHLLAVHTDSDGSIRFETVALEKLRFSTR